MKHCVKYKLPHGNKHWTKQRLLCTSLCYTTPKSFVATKRKSTCIQRHLINMQNINLWEDILLRQKTACPLLEKPLIWVRMSLDSRVFQASLHFEKIQIKIQIKSISPVRSIHNDIITIPGENFQDAIKYEQYKIALWGRNFLSLTTSLITYLLNHFLDMLPKIHLLATIEEQLASWVCSFF